jgi:hypothetical protein
MHHGPIWGMDSGANLSYFSINPYQLPELQVNRNETCQTDTP